MTTYAFSEVLVYAQVPGGQLRLLKNGSVQVLDATGSPALGTGALLATVTADSNGAATFTTTDKPVVDVKDPATGYVRRVASTDAIVAAANSVPSNDAAINTVVTTPGSATQTSLDGRYVGKGALVVNVKDYGAVGDGTTDDTTAIQNAINAAGVGGKVILPRGAGANSRFRCNSGLTLLDYQTLEGSGQSVTRTATPTTELYFPGLTGAAVALTLGAGCTVRNVQLRGPGSTTGTVTGISTANTEATYDFVYLMSFATGVSQTGTFYSVFNRCGWRSCGVGLLLTGCYNVNLNNPRFACLNETTTAWGTAIQTDKVRPLTINGGSFEEYGAGGGIKVTAAQSQINLFGTYWESNATTSPVGLVATGLTSVSIAAIGNLVYLDGHANWMDFTGTSGRIISQGHRFSCATTSTTTPTVYKMTAGGFLRGELGPDDWADVLKASVGFDGQTVGNAPGLTIQRPVGFGSGSSDIVMQGRAIAQAQKTVTANYTVTGDDYTIVANGTSITVTLPDPLSGNTLKGRRYVIKNINSTSLTVNCSPGTRTIDGATSVTLAQWQTITVECDFATGYLVVGKV